jgi:isoleucyl-tRNA synthetase
MEKKELRKKAIEEIEKVRWIPIGSKNRIMSMVKDRPDWCVSRQRMWGVPITIFVSKKTGKPLIDRNVNNKILKVLKEKGVESWFELPNETFLTESYLSDEYYKVDSILDVWFDSGSSHVYVLKNNKIKDKADLYLEGSDQHRGWFQTSLLESCANYGESPYKAVLTHGFVIDENGRKMSKSLGNVISPSDIIKKYGADILRIWVANSNTNEDVKISFENLERQSENYRKIRNTIRFILGNMRGWNRKSIDYNDFESLEKFICYRLWELNKEINLLYESYNFNKIFQLVLNFCSQELSTLFFDIRKDTLYCEKSDSIKVNQTKTVLKYVFNCLIRWISPIIPFTTEEAWQSWKNEIDDTSIESCHLLQVEALPDIWDQDEIKLLWDKILAVKNLFSLCVEKKRNSKEIKSGLEAKVFIHLGSDYEIIKNKVDLSEILISADVHYVEKCDEDFESDSDKNFFIKVESADGEKCPRCWKYFKNIEKSNLCKRCEKVISE